MHAHSAIRKMSDYHTRLRTLLDRSSEALANDAVDIVTLAGLRWQLVRLLREYQLFKHTEIFDPIIRHRPLGRNEHASRLKARCEIMGTRYNDFIKRWHLGASGPSSSDYRDAARKMIDDVAQHVVEEGGEIARLLDRLNEINR